MNRQRFISIRTRLLIMLFICILIPFLIYWFYSYRYIKNSLGQKFITQSTDMMDASANTITSYVQLVNYTARGMNFNSEVMDILLNSEKFQDYQTLELESKLFNYMQMMFASVPDSSQIHLSAFRLKKSLLLRDDMQRYEKDHIYLNPERQFGCAPYGSYIIPTHMQSDYNFNTLPFTDFNLVFSLNMPIYEIPMVTDPLGEISIDIPISVLESICRPLFQEEESLCIVDSAGNYIYSSLPMQTGTPVKEANILQIIDSASLQNQTHVVELDAKNIIICSPLTKDPLSWYLIKISPISFVYEDAMEFFKMIFFTFIFVLIVETLLLILIVLQFTNPIQKLTAYAEAVNQGNLDEKMSKYITYSRNDEIGTLIVTLRRMMHSINHFIIHQYQLEIANRTSELKALQAQINPHFIYNTLQCIGTSALDCGNLPLYHSIASLGQMMQYSMDTTNSQVPLKDCLHHIELYLNLQMMRFPSSLDYKFIVDPGLEQFIIPKMILQPLVENSIRHGNILNIEDGHLTIRVSMKDNFISIWVEDTGTGITFKKIDELNDKLKRVKEDMSHSDANVFFSSLNHFPEENEDGHAADSKTTKISEDTIGLSNVYQRLLLFFKRQCLMEILTNTSCGTTVHIQIDSHMGEFK